LSYDSILFALKKFVYVMGFIKTIFGLQQALMSPAPNRGSSAAIGDSHLHSQGTPAPAGMFGPSTPAPMTPHTPASADPGIVPQLQ
jgi:transcription initiation factor TFIID TATA-box-binding protein